MEILGLLVLAILGFAIYGLVCFCRLLFKPSEEKPLSQGPEVNFSREKEKEDVRGAERLLDHFYLTGKVDDEQYDRLRTILEQNYREILLRDRLGKRSPVLAGQAPVEPADAQAPATTAIPVAEVIDAESVATQQPSQRPSATRPERPPRNEPQSRPHPLDAKEPVEAQILPAAPVPKRSFAEMLAGFMEKRNIRWGELASGILIVGSVIGLVISLREELRDRIPYFSALVFLLLTAAIHGAGTYTLRRWKLRNTSRGVLLIGMLLIPLNFLAACLLNGAPDQRRSLSDPLLWVAVAVGLTAYSLMSWFSTRNLFRIRYLATAISVVVTGVSILVVNRMDHSVHSIVSTLLMAAGSFVAWHASVLSSAPRILQGSYASRRFRDRLLTIAGIGLFSLSTLVAMLLIRSESRIETLLSLTPLTGSVAIALIAIGDRLVNRKPDSVEAATQQIAESTGSLVGRSVCIFGWVILLLSIAGCVFHPQVTFAFGAAVISMAAALRFKRRVPGMAVAAWIALAGMILVVAAVMTSRISLWSWSSFRQLAVGVSHSQSGIAILLAALLALAASWFLKQATGKTELVADSKWANVIPQQLHRFGVAQLIALVAACVGVLWLVAASALHRSDVWDVSLGTISLIVAATGGLFFAARSQLAAPVKSIVIALLLISGIHLLYWNGYFSEFVLERSWFRKSTSGFDARFLLLMAICAVSLSICNLAASRRKRLKVLDSIQVACWITIGVAICITIALCRLQSFAAIACLIVSGFATGLLFACRTSQKLNAATTVNQVLMSLSMVALVANVVTKFGIADSVRSATHALLQFSVLAIVIAGVHVLRSSIKWGDWKWLLHTVVGSFLAWSLFSLGNATLVELVAGYEGQIGGWLDLGELIWPLALVCVIMFAALSLVARSETAVAEGVLSGLVLVIAVSSIAIPFAASNATATALRWLVPLGVAAVAIPIGCRKLLPQGIRERLMLNAEETDQQTVINSLLAFAVVVVLGFSTIAIARFLLIGNEALGGPVSGSLFGDLRRDISYGVPVALIVATLLWFANTEKRCFLAMAGSGVFQYVVLLSIVLLFLSPHPKLASRWFINIMQAVSLGMTLYGLIWLWQRERIGQGSVDFGLTTALARWKMIDAHAGFNILLVLSMVVLIYQRYFFYPSVSGAWIASAGSLAGIVTAVSVTVFAGLLWKRQLPKLIDLFLLFGGLASVAFVAAWVDRIHGTSPFVPWSCYRVLTAGSLAVVGLLLGKTLIQLPGFRLEGLSIRTSIPESQAKYSRVAIGIAIGVSFVFCIFGADADLEGSSIYLIGSALLIFAMACHAWFFGSSFVGFAVLPMVWVFASQLTQKLAIALGGGMGVSTFDIFQTQLGATGIIAAVWVFIARLSVGFRRKPNTSQFFLMPNAVVFVGGIVAVLTAAATLMLSTKNVIFQISGYQFFGAIGIGAAWFAGLWSRQSRFRFVAGLMFVASLVTLLAGLLPDSVLRNVAMRFSLLMFAWALSLNLIALVWVRFAGLKRIARKLGAVDLKGLDRLVDRRLKVWIYLVGSIIFLFALMVVWNCELRAARLTAGFASLAVAVSAIVVSLRNPVREMQFCGILAVVTAFAMISVAGEGVSASISAHQVVFLRALVVPALGVFLFGVFATRWLRAGDSWEIPIRDATAVLTATTIFGSLIMLALQFQVFDPDLGSQIGVSRAVTLFVLLLAMVVGLLMIAVVPKRDPFSLSDDGRKGYVYVAQIVVVIAGAHLYLSMPWLLKTGILQYWPYVAIAVSLVGVAISEVLKRRDLTVLSEPIFATAALIPVLVSIGYWLIDSRADASLTFFLAGLIYLGIAMRYGAVWSGLMAMVLGNLSLWIFYSQRSIEFSSHPQLWMIPPAVCVLLASWLERKWLSEKQLTAIRYACVFVIYLSSTSEILINGIGQQVWPPLALAVLSIAGMAAGIMLQVRSFLFVGVSFLFVSVIAMVSHAQQRLDHVWPWWAFGILTGAGILVVFGLFEKRRNDLIRLGQQLRDWKG